MVQKGKPGRLVSSLVWEYGAESKKAKATKIFRKHTGRKAAQRREPRRFSKVPPKTQLSTGQSRHKRKLSKAWEVIPTKLKGTIPGAHLRLEITPLPTSQSGHQAECQKGSCSTVGKKSPGMPRSRYLQSHNPKEEKNQSTETNPEMTQITEVVDKDILKK